MIRAFKFRAYMKPDVEQKLVYWIGLCRELYNAALQERIDCYQRNIARRVTPLERAFIVADSPRKPPKKWTCTHGMTVGEQQARLPEIKQDRPEFAEIGSQVLKDVLRRLDKSYQAFFRRVKQGTEAPGFPKFKGQRYYRSFVFPNASGWRLLPGPKPGRMQLWVRNAGQDAIMDKYGKPILGGILQLRESRSIPRGIPKAATIRTVTIRQVPTGDWYVIFSCDNVPMEPLPEVNRTIALDVGVNRFLTDSDGTVVRNPQFFKDYERKLRILDRKLARQKRGSKRREATFRERARLHRTVANRREDFHCKLALDYVRQYDRIIHEDLSIKGLIQDGKHKVGGNGKLSTRIADVAWGGFFQRVDNACEKHFRDVEAVDPAFTTRTCNMCGAAWHRPITEMLFKCPDPACGYEEDRPFNSALNIEDVANDEFRTTAEAQRAGVKGDSATSPLPAIP